MLRRIYSVGEATGYLRDLLEADSLLGNIWIRGEISNCKHHTSGHLYFTLKDASSSMRCVMFRSRCSKLTFLPVNGMSVIVRGNISVYERDGQYQLYAEELAPDGTGALYAAYCRLKEQLQAEGLFAQEHKKPLPPFPRRVGVVTSQNGAAWHDLATVLRRRFPGISIVLAPASVQGDQAPREISAALEALDRRQDVDVIIVGRGGGSLEELWAFNTVEVARTIFGMRHPVVSAVGHETDYSIADLVADVRAATPSAAAELVAPLRLELENRLRRLQDRLVLAGIQGTFRQKQRQLQEAGGLIRYPRRLLTDYQQDLKLLHMQLLHRMKNERDQAAGRKQALSEKLDSLSPLAILKRGYSICRQPGSGRLILSGRNVMKGDILEVILGEGGLNCEVIEKWDAGIENPGPDIKREAQRSKQDAV
jgi:exodeoxyribonuclease VII large subunit